MTSKRDDSLILADLLSVETQLSPENLHCDGERSPAAARKVEARLHEQRKALHAELGRIPSDRELYESERVANPNANKLLAKMYG